MKVHAKPAFNSSVFIKFNFFLVWKTVLYLYMYDNSLPLPTNEEIVVCTETTSVEEVKHGICAVISF